MTQPLKKITVFQSSIKKLSIILDRSVKNLNCQASDLKISKAIISRKFPNAGNTNKIVNQTKSKFDHS